MRINSLFLNTHLPKSATMEIPGTLLSVLISLLTISSLPSAQSNGYDSFLGCFSDHITGNHSSVSDILSTPDDPSFLPTLQSSIRNLRFTSPSTPRPRFIITPVEDSQVQAAVRCSRRLGLQIRTRSGGHDYEGLSYSSHLPFVIVDLINMSEITLDVGRKTAWIQSGATIGQLYYRISQESRTLAFPAGACPTVGVGGHFSGGGYGASLIRKYGMAADNIVDARMVDADGRILDRESMGEDLFWAIRGGGGASFGIIIAWKLNLVSVPETVTICPVNRTLEQNATQLIHMWQYIAPSLPKDLVVPVSVVPINSNRTRQKTILAMFNILFQGRVGKLLGLMMKRFPEFDLKRTDCQEVSWIQASVFVGGYPVHAPPQVLASPVPLTKLYFKAKSDYVQKPIPKHAFQGIWKLMFDKDANMSQLFFTPYGGRMDEIPESAIPFPHRAGNLYKIQHLVYWDEPGLVVSKRYINWIRRLYKYMTPYVSKNPRSAYINYRDLDIGVNDKGNTSYAKASIWGFKYFNRNFDRLVHVKTKIDPNNYFRNEQSIPTLCSKEGNKFS